MKPQQQHDARIYRQDVKIDTGYPADEINRGMIIKDLTNWMHTVDYYHKVIGESMQELGYYDGDIVAVCHTTRLRKYCTIVCRIFNQELLKTYIPSPDGRIILRSENPDYEDIIVTELMDLQIIGIVVGKVQIDYMRLYK